MKQEELKKDYILLSKVAKEKKYAQEYLGLLARRGDIGSIRIGKRWYTTREWFSEFLADAEEKRAVTKIVKPESAPIKMEAVEKIKIEKVIAPRAVEFAPRIIPDKIEMKKESGIIRENVRKEKIIMPGSLEGEASREKFYVRKEKIAPAVPVGRRPFRVERNFGTIDLRNLNKEKIVATKKTVAENLNGAINIKRESEPQIQARKRKIFREWRSRSRGVSPNFADKVPQIPFFQKFAFSASMVLLLVLIFQFGLIFKDDLKRLAGMGSGTVAGASDSKVDISAVKNSSLGYLGKQEGQVKENISLSRVLIRAAMEREKQ